MRWNTMVKWGRPWRPSAPALDRGLQPCPFGWSGSARTPPPSRISSGPAGGQRVCYPAARTTPSTAAKAQMPSFGPMLAFDVGSSPALKVVTAPAASFAASLGGVRTVTQIPGTMAFLDIPEEERARKGITPGMVRISAGIEGIEDLKADSRRP